MLTAVVLIGMMVIAYCLIKSAYQIIRVFVIRASFMKKVNKKCVEKMYSITHPRTFLASIIKTSSTPDMIIRTPENEFIVRFITCRQRKRMWYFVNAEYYVRVLRVYFNFPGSKRYDPMDLNRKMGRLPPIDNKYSDESNNSAKTTLVMLFNPSPVEINYIDENNKKFIAGNGSVIYGWTVYDGNAFLSLL